MKKFLHLVFLCILILASTQSQSQNTVRPQRIDSLRNTFNNKSLSADDRLGAIENITLIYINHNMPDSALFSIEQTLGFAKQKNDTNYIARTHSTKAEAYLLKNDAEKALAAYQESYDVYEKLKNESFKGHTLWCMGTVYEKQSNNPKALEYYLRSLKIYEAAKDNYGLGRVYNNMGNVYNSQRDYPEALNYYSKSLKLWEEIGDKNWIADCNKNMGNVYKNKRAYSESMDYYMKAYNLYEEINSREGIGACLSDVAYIYKDKSDFNKALEYFLMSLGQLKQTEDKHNISKCYESIGSTYLELKNYPTSMLYLDSALYMSIEINNINNQRNVYNSLSKLYAQTGRYQEAYMFNVKYHAITDSIFNANNSKTLNDLASAYETEKKEAEQAKTDAIAAEEKRKHQIIIISVSISLLLVLVLAVVILRSLRLNKKKNKIISAQKHLVEEQKNLVEEKHKEITDSINYAERIQRSFLASKELLQENLKEHFVFFQPKDVVSGDFYWAGKLKNEQFALVTADSTGHGVPGAIMSILNISCLEQSIEEKQLIQPSEILNHTRSKIIERLKKDGTKDGGKDGMDCSIISFDLKNNIFTYSAANNPIWIVRGSQKELIELKPDKMPVGKHDKDANSFTQHSFNIEKGDVIYTLTDGMPDQFGGPNGKKFMYKQLKELLISVSHLPMINQKEKLLQALNKWKGVLEQVDDICIVGVRI